MEIGNAAEWAGVVLGAVTLYYLIRKFSQQKSEITRLHTKEKKDEAERQFFNLLPNFYSLTQRSHGYEARLKIKQRFGNSNSVKSSHDILQNLNDKHLLSDNDIHEHEIHTFASLFLQCANLLGALSTLDRNLENNTLSPLLRTSIVSLYEIFGKGFTLLALDSHRNNGTLSKEAVEVIAKHLIDHRGATIEALGFDPHDPASYIKQTTP